jgi:hypothetical protein
MSLLMPQSAERVGANFVVESLEGYILANMHHHIPQCLPVDEKKHALQRKTTTASVVLK